MANLTFSLSDCRLAIFMACYFYNSLFSFLHFLYFSASSIWVLSASLFICSISRSLLLYWARISWIKLTSSSSLFSLASISFPWASIILLNSSRSAEIFSNYFYLDSNSASRSLSCSFSSKIYLAYWSISAKSCFSLSYFFFICSYFFYIYWASPSFLFFKFSTSCFSYSIVSFLSSNIASFVLSLASRSSTSIYLSSSYFYFAVNLSTSDCRLKFDYFMLANDFYKDVFSYWILDN